jgi:hypothetical protein
VRNEVIVLKTILYMKRFALLAPAFILIALVSCRRESCYNCHNGGNCYNGSCQCPPGYSGPNCDSLITSTHNTALLTFWASNNCNCGPITVTCGGYVQKMSEYFPNDTPACGTHGCANFALTAGTYTYQASCQDTSWSGTVTVDSNSCTLQHLGCTTGSAIFWVDSTGSSGIKVSMGGQNASISTAYTASTPLCGAAGCATFLLPAGAYNYTATSTANSWSGTVVITNNGCASVKLQ